jgi:predicted  nucleic acid-binding Zn-ribbon protein
MRLSILILAIVGLFFKPLYAQLPIEVDEKVMPMSRGNQPGLEVMIHDAELKDVQKEWENYMKSADRPDINEEKDEIQALGATVEAISNQPINVFAKFTELKGGTYGQIFFQFEDDFLSSKSSSLKLQAAKKFVYDFAIQEYRYAIEEKLGEEEDKLKDIEKEKKKIIKDIDDNHKTISENERDINQIKNDLKINESDQDVMVQQITKQKKLVLEYAGKSEEAEKAAEKELGDYENDYKKLQKENEKLHKKIDDAEEDIREAERNLDMNKADLSRKQDEMIEQKAIIEVIKEKLENLE